MPHEHGFERVCRTCMLESSCLLPLFGGHQSVDDASACSLLASFTTIKAQPSDGLPQRICLTCVGEINRVVSFKQKCERSERTLWSLVQMHNQQTARPDILDDDEIPNKQPTTSLPIELSDANNESFPDLREISLYLDTNDDRFSARNSPPDIVELLGADESIEGPKGVYENEDIYQGYADNTRNGNAKTDNVTELKIERIDEISFVALRIAGQEFSSAQEEEKEEARDSHPKMSNMSFECYVCKSPFVDMNNLAIHFKKHLGRTSNHSCKLYDKQFSRSGQLRTHLQDHSAVFKHRCPHCAKGFHMRSNLHDHIRSHSGERPFVCTTCGKGFTQRTNMRQHMKRHSNVKDYRCNTCGNAYVTKAELTSHLRTHSGVQPFMCDVCGSSFSTGSTLVKHRRTHTGERPYACEYCPMRFGVLATLKNHRRTHTGEKPYRCEWCDRAFTQRSDCVKHQRAHTDERFRCPICRQQFVKKSTLNEHLRCAHNCAIGN